MIEIEGRFRRQCDQRSGKQKTLAHVSTFKIKSSLLLSFKKEGLSSVRQ
jgi:hypothetical protein